MKSSKKKSRLRPEPRRAQALSSRKYPVPKETGGKLIRSLVRSLRESGCALPITSHILCACSGGADSTALAVLLARYGRRVAGASQIYLLHVNHGWRGAESDADEAFVRRLAKKLDVGFVSHRLTEKPAAGDSWEAHARSLRKAIFRKESQAHGNAPVLTAHTADDQAETRLWRFLTGVSDTHGEGILPRHEAEIRPLLSIRRSALRDFLKEERQPWREDSSNQDPRFLRARMRRDLMPVIETLFPGAIDAISNMKACQRGSLQEKRR